MAGDIISKKTRTEFREFFVGWTLREIEREFEAADVPREPNDQCPESGARRSFVETYYHAVDFTKWEDVRKILAVYENVLTTVSQGIGTTYDAQLGRRTLDGLTRWLARDGFNFENGRLHRKGGE